MSQCGRLLYLMEPIDGFNALNGLGEYHNSDPAICQRMGLARSVIPAGL